MRLETKFHQPGVTVSDDAVVTGYASVFGLRDQGGDIVMPGAFAASLAAAKATGRAVKMLWQHDQAQPIGLWDEIVEDAHGLRVKGRLLTDVARAREAATLMQAGVIDGLSIGYRTRRAQKTQDGGRQLIELELFEISLVTFPMLPQARIAAKADDTWTPLGDITRALIDARAALRGAPAERG